MICFIILDVSFGVCTLRSFFLEKKKTLPVRVLQQHSKVTKCVLDGRRLAVLQTQYLEGVDFYVGGAVTACSDAVHTLCARSLHV